MKSPQLALHVLVLFLKSLTEFQILLTFFQGQELDTLIFQRTSLGMKLLSNMPIE